VNVGWFNFSQSIQGKVILRDRAGSQYGDAALINSGGNLYFPYAGINNAFNNTQSSNAQSWNDWWTAAYPVYWGISGADVNGHLWLVWGNYPSS